MTDHANPDRTAAPDLRIALRKYTLYRVARAAGFGSPFVVVFIVGNGVTYTDIGIGTSAMAVVMIVTEVPSGYVADRLGRRNTLVVSQALSAVAVTGYLVVDSTSISDDRRFGLKISSG